MMIATYNAWLTQENTVDWRDAAPEPFTGRVPVQISFVDAEDDEEEEFITSAELDEECAANLREAEAMRAAGARDIPFDEFIRDMRAMIQRVAAAAK